MIFTAKSVQEEYNLKNNYWSDEILSPRCLWPFGRKLKRKKTRAHKILCVKPMESENRFRAKSLKRNYYTYFCPVLFGAALPTLNIVSAPLSGARQGAANCNNILQWSPLSGAAFSHGSGDGTNRPYTLAGTRLFCSDWMWMQSKRLKKKNVRIPRLARCRSSAVKTGLLKKINKRTALIVISNQSPVSILRAEEKSNYFFFLRQSD